MLGEATLLLATVDVGRCPFTLALLVAVSRLDYRRADHRAPTMFLIWAIIVVPIELLDDDGFNGGATVPSFIYNGG